jgi:tetrahydromethanopterin S-methyltransferase subunit G
MISDKISWMNQDFGILGSLIVGIIITLISLMRLNKIIDEKREK